MELKLRKLKKGESTPKLKYELLQNDPVTRQMYAIAVKNRFEALEIEGEPKWNVLKEALVTSAKEIIPKQERPNKQKWMTEEILNLTKKRQTIFNRESQEYKFADRQIKHKCRQEKDVWFNKKCEEIERCETSNTSICLMPFYISKA